MLKSLKLEFQGPTGHSILAPVDCLRALLISGLTSFVRVGILQEKGEREFFCSNPIRYAEMVSFQTVV